MSTRSARYNTLDMHTPKGRMLSGSDRDAAAFLEAAGIVAGYQQRAIYELVRLLKQYGLWSKMKAIYPFVGGTATTHKWNLKDPRDLDAAFRLQFLGAWTHSSTGADPGGGNGTANTYFKPATSLAVDSAHYAGYFRENVVGAFNDMGVKGTGNAQWAFIAGRWQPLDNNSYNDCWRWDTGRVAVSSTDTRGFFVSSRISTTSLKTYRNGAQLGATNTTTAQAADFNTITGNTYLASYNGTTNFSIRQMAYVSLGDGLTDAEAANLYNAVQRYQQLLGRAV